MKGYIYRAYLPSGISYIGQTIDINKRKIMHWKSRNDGLPFHIALKLFGRESFVWEILEECEEHELNNKEKKWIAYYDSYENGLNNDDGGRTGYISRHPTELTRQKQSEGSKGRTLTDEHKQKIGLASRGRTFSEEARRKMGDANRGKTMSEEHKRKIKESNIGKNKGRTAWNKGLTKDTDKRVAAYAKTRWG